MVLYLNPYRNFINVSMKDGQLLLSNATDKFELPLVGDQHIHLRPGRSDFQNLKDDLMRCSWKYGYQYLLNDVATTRTVTPGVPPALATITFSNSIKILHVYDDKLLESAQKHAFITWGNDSFTVRSLKVISEITQADGHLTAVSWLTQKGKDLIQGRLHSKIMASQTLSMLVWCTPGWGTK
jgi:hypothetical protein